MKVLIVIAFLFIITMILNKLYMNTNYYKNSIHQLKKFINGVPNGLEIINIGSSYAKYAFDYSIVPFRGFNFALEPQSLSYDFRILKQYLSYLQDNCVVIITIPDLVFCFLDYKDDYTNKKYYYFLNSQNIKGYSKLKYFARVICPILSSRKSFLKIFNDEAIDNRYYQTENFKSEIDVINDAKNRIKGWIKEFNLNNTQDENISEELEHIFTLTTRLLNEMIGFCIENSLKPVIVVPPTTRFLNNLISEEFIDKVLYSNIRKGNQYDIPVLDYLKDEEFQKHELYINSDLLNAIGRKKFTKRVINDLANVGFIGGVNCEN